MSSESPDTVIFDTDVMVWVGRGNERALEVVGDAAERAISIFTYMELIQGSKSPSDIRRVKDFISDGAFQVLPLTENIGHRAVIYLEEYAHSSGLRAEDAIIAATAIETGFMLVSGNRKHFKSIKELKFRPFLVA